MRRKAEKSKNPKNNNRIFLFCILFYPTSHTWGVQFYHGRRLSILKGGATQQQLGISSPPPQLASKKIALAPLAFASSTPKLLDDNLR